MNINHSGANINIMCGGGVGTDEQKEGDRENVIQQSNNFIFNHTAPINLNFYEESKKNQGQKGNNRTNQAGADKKVLMSGEAEIIQQQAQNK